MAIENKAFLSGQIRKLRKFKNEQGRTTQIQMGVLVLRRPKKKEDHIREEWKMDIVIAVVVDQKQIAYVEEMNAAEGDTVQICGVFCTLRANKGFICKNCGAKNVYEGVVSYVHTKSIQVGEINPKRVEIVTLDPFERHGSLDEIMELLRTRKKESGTIVRTEEAGRDKFGNYLIQVTSREPVTEEQLRKWFMQVEEASNEIFLIGHLCSDPVFNTADRGGRICTYRLGINRKIYIPEDVPTARADFPWIRSLGDQAEKDRGALKKGSLVFIDGAIQARTYYGEHIRGVRSGFKVKKVCSVCGSENEVKDGTMEIVPYSVEYLRGCSTETLRQDEEILDEQWADMDPIAHDPKGSELTETS